MQIPGRAVATARRPTTAERRAHRTAMREITLQEYVRSEPMRLSAAELSTLQTSKLSINIAPTLETRMANTV